MVSLVISTAPITNRGSAMGKVSDGGLSVTEASCSPAVTDDACSKDLCDLLVKIEAMKEKLRQSQLQRQDAHRPVTPSVQ